MAFHYVKDEAGWIFRVVSRDARGEWISIDQHKYRPRSKTTQFVKNTPVHIWVPQSPSYAPEVLVSRANKPWPIPDHIDPRSPLEVWVFTTEENIFIPYY